MAKARKTVTASEFAEAQEHLRDHIINRPWYRGAALTEDPKRRRIIPTFWTTDIKEAREYAKVPIFSGQIIKGYKPGKIITAKIDPSKILFGGDPDAAVQLGIADQYEALVDKLGKYHVETDKLISKEARRQGYQAQLIDMKQLEIYTPNIITVTKQETVPVPSRSSRIKSERKPSREIGILKPKPAIKQSYRGVAIDRSLLAKNVVQVNDTRWLKQPNRYDVRGIDTPGSRRIIPGVAYADKGGKRLSRKRHRGWKRLNLR